MRPSFLGNSLLHWCDTCHAPVLDGTCGCGSKTRAVPVTPPGDVRPAFPFDVEMVNRIYESHFGAPLIPPGHLSLLNKVPDTDRMEEVIVGGAVVGAIRFMKEIGEWEPIPRPESTVLLKPKARYVVADRGAIPSIRDEGASLLAPGLVEIEESVRKGDEVFILDPDGSCAGVGRSKVDAKEARKMEKGSIVRTRRNVPAECVPGKATWEDAISANARILERMEDESVEFIQDVAGKHPIPVNVSYSGGKDSLATLLLVVKAIGEVPLLFADTGLEFPETYRNVREVSERYGLRVIRAHGEREFWDEFDREGPPAVNFRWCCRTAKLNPVKTAIRKEWGECLSFIGQRKYESFRRMMSRRVWRNPNVTNQLSAAPIQHWTALHVWLYLFREKAPYNTLYAEGLDRIGCYMCPSSDIAVLRRIRETHPLLWEQWSGRLLAWQKKKGLPDEWLSADIWRMRGANPDEEDHNC